LTIGYRFLRLELIIMPAVVIGFHLMHELADLPPALSGSP
jgi:hypothetical protein